MCLLSFTFIPHFQTKLETPPLTTKIILPSHFADTYHFGVPGLPDPMLGNGNSLEPGKGQRAGKATLMAVTI